MADNRSGTGRSAMLAGGPLLGQSGRWFFERATSAMDSLPGIGQEISLSGSFLIS
jgi:hypothetical protein